MIASLPRPAWLRAATVLYVAAFLIFLFLPLVTVAVFAFNDAPYPAPPWRGFTLDWFLGSEESGRIGLFHDTELLGSIWTSVVVSSWVTVLSLTVGTANAFLMERYTFPGKQALSVLMLTPLVIPGVILGISILSLSSRLADLLDALFGLDLDILRPGLPLVVLGQFAYVVTIATLIVSARLKRFDRTLEEAALNLGASHAAVLRTITFPYLRPAMMAEANIRNRLTALSTGLAPSRIRPYIMTVSGESAPTSMSVVLKFSNDIRNEMAAAPIIAGRR